MPDRPLLIFGGTFDPPQVAHVEVARAVCAALDADLLVVPAAGNPLKDRTPTDGHHRLAMVRLAFNRSTLPDIQIEISSLELDRPPPSYTVDTLEALRDRFGPARPFRLLMGSDAALEFGRWRRPERILELATPAIVLRPPVDIESFRATLLERCDTTAADRWCGWIVDAPSLDVAATDVRRRLADGGSTDGLLDPAVVSYIERHGLYR